MLELKALFGILSSIFILVGFLPYLIDIHRKKVKPHILSWIGWGFVTGLGAIAMFSEGFGWGGVIVAANTILCFTIATYSAYKKVGVWTTTKFDYLFFVFGFLGIALWQIFNNPDLAIGSAILADLSFGIPNLIKIYKEPSSETLFPWLMAVLSGLSSLVAIHYISFTEIAYPIYLTLYDGSTFVLVAAGLLFFSKKLSVE